ncbi:hypothetical protein ACJ7V3_11010 [Halomonas elongata]|uniref:hypothetical protein n=1 Tax=Halomonas elongata TaxID=2746 RepID=UPI0038D3CC50
MTIDRMDILGPITIVVGFFLVYDFFMALVTIGLTGHIVEKANKRLSILTTEKDSELKK